MADISTWCPTVTLLMCRKYKTQRTKRHLRKIFYTWKHFLHPRDTLLSPHVRHMTSMFQWYSVMTAPCSGLHTGATPSDTRMQNTPGWGCDGSKLKCEASVASSASMSDNQDSLVRLSTWIDPHQPPLSLPLHMGPKHAPPQLFYERLHMLIPWTHAASHMYNSILNTPLKSSPRPCRDH